MNYNQYKDNQIKYGRLKNHYKQRLRERVNLAYVLLTNNLIQKEDYWILDVGCGTGNALEFLQKIGFKRIRGIEINPCKALMCSKKGLAVYGGDILEYPYWCGPFDFFWLSHSFEHMYNPSKALEIMLKKSYPNAKFHFIMPYPDTGNQAVHTASKEIGLTTKDWGVTTRKWFEDHGLDVLNLEFYNYLEPEIWITGKPS